MRGDAVIPEVVCLRCDYRVKCIKVKDGTVYKPLTWKYADEGKSLYGWCFACVDKFIGMFSPS